MQGIPLIIQYKFGELTRAHFFTLQKLTPALGFKYFLLAFLHPNKKYQLAENYESGVLLTNFVKHSSLFGNFFLNTN